MAEQERAALVERLRLKLPVKMDAQANYIWDADGQMLFDIRGWGFLTGVRLTDPEAEAVQRARGQALVDAFNAALAAAPERPQVGCEDASGVLHIHDASVTCQVCAPATAPDTREAIRVLEELQIWLHRDMEFGVSTVSTVANLREWLAERLAALRADGAPPVAPPREPRAEGEGGDRG